MLLIINPRKYYLGMTLYPKSQDDMSQYMTNWTSGYGIDQSVNWLEHRAEKQKIIVFIRQDFGNPESAMVVYLSNNKNIKLLSINVFPQVMAAINKTKTDYPMYFVSRGNQFAGMEKYLIKRARFPKPDGNEFVGIYQIRVRS